MNSVSVQLVVLLVFGSRVEIFVFVLSFPVCSSQISAANYCSGSSHFLFGFWVHAGFGSSGRAWFPDSRADFHFPSGAGLIFSLLCPLFFLDRT
jgi:hypothetical protein